MFSQAVRVGDMSHEAASRGRNNLCSHAPVRAFGGYFLSVSEYLFTANRAAQVLVQRPAPPFTRAGAGGGGSLLAKTLADFRSNVMRTSCYHFATQLGSTTRYWMARRRRPWRESPDNLGLLDTEQNGETQRQPNYKTAALPLS